MKNLRILTGMHAGANLRLNSGIYEITRFRTDEEAHMQHGAVPITSPKEIQLVDWDDATLQLTISDVGIATYSLVGKTDGHLTQTPWIDFDVHRWGEVAICLGDANEPWPSDADLLQRFNGEQPANSVPSDESHVEVKRKFWVARAGVLGVGLLITLGALYGRTGIAAPEPSDTRPRSATATLVGMLAQDDLAELKIVGNDKGIDVSGLVVDATVGRRVRGAVDNIETKFGFSIGQSWQVASDISATIEAALRMPSVHARYLGEGRFEIYGVAKDLQLISSAADQLKNDLGSNVREIEVNVAPVVIVAPFSVAMSSPGVRYSQRPDGAKLFDPTK